MAYPGYPPSSGVMPLGGIQPMGQAQGYPPANYNQGGGYPPQGYPPQGYPPQGYPPQGYPPQGYPPQASPFQPPTTAYDAEVQQRDRIAQLPAPERHCLGGHILHEAAVPSRWNCDACKTTFSQKEPSYGCRRCDFDVCRMCIDGPPCKGRHALLYAVVPCRWKCDVCSKLSGAGMPSRGCRTCDYDMCMTCYGKEKKKIQQQRLQEEQHSHASPAPAHPQHHPQPTPQPTPMQPPTVRGLFIGINYPGTSAALRGCVNDVCTMYKLMLGVGLQFTETRFLVDETKDFKHQVHAAPEKRHILDSLRWLVAGVKRGDTLVLHYSGHGSQMKDQDQDEDDGYDETLVPADYERHGQIRDDDVFDIVCRHLPAGVRLTAVTDCCHSGTIMDLQYNWAWDGEQGKFRDPAQKRPREQQVVTRGFHAESKKSSAADIVLFSGCNDKQTSADVSNVHSFKHSYNGPGAAGGACTNALAEVVAAHHKPGTGPSLDISYGELLLHLQENLKKRRYTQIPQLSTSKHFPMDDIVSFTGPL